MLPVSLYHYWAQLYIVWQTMCLPTYSWMKSFFFFLQQHHTIDSFLNPLKSFHLFSTVLLPAYMAFFYTCVWDFFVPTVIICICALNFMYLRPFHQFIQSSLSHSELFQIPSIWTSSTKSYTSLFHWPCSEPLMKTLKRTRFIKHS